MVNIKCFSYYGFCKLIIRRVIPQRRIHRIILFNTFNDIINNKLTIAKFCTVNGFQDWPLFNRSTNGSRSSSFASFMAQK